MHKISPPILNSPVPFTVFDSITRDGDGNITFHYVIVEVAGTPVDPTQQLQAADDALAAR